MTISPALPPVQPSSCAIRLAHRLCAACQQQFVELRGVVPVWRGSCPCRPCPPGHGMAAVDPDQRIASFGSAGPKLISMRVPTGCSTGVTLDDAGRAVALRAQLIRRLRVMTASEPSDASTAPATTRSPLPSAPWAGEAACWSASGGGSRTARRLLRACRRARGRRPRRSNLIGVEIAT